MVAASRKLDRLVVARDRLNAAIAAAEREAEREYFTQSTNEFFRTASQPADDPLRPVAGNCMEYITMKDRIRPGANWKELRGIAYRPLSDDGSAVLLRMPKMAAEGAKHAGAAASDLAGVDARKVRRITRGVLTVLGGVNDEERQHVGEAALLAAVHLLRGQPLTSIQALVEQAYAESNDHDDADEFF